MDASHPDFISVRQVMAGVPAIGFLMALATRGIYGGSLSDPGGVPQFKGIMAALHR